MVLNKKLFFITLLFYICTFITAGTNVTCGHVQPVDDGVRQKFDDTVLNVLGSNGDIVYPSLDATKLTLVEEKCADVLVYSGANRLMDGLTVTIVAVLFAVISYVNSAIYT